MEVKVSHIVQSVVYLELVTSIRLITVEPEPEPVAGFDYEFDFDLT